jgi:hypothetical protein
MAKKRTAEPSAQIQEYLGCMKAYEREFVKWEKRVERILKRYRDEDRPSNKTSIARFNILWSNVQTLVPATFSKLPQPDVSRRFRDQDPVGRVASLILERSLDFEIQHYEDYRATMRQSVYDRFLGGRGTAWVRYEPHFKQAQKKSLPEDGAQVTEDTDDAPVNEQLDYECAKTDYVHWRDFGHDVARTWEEVTTVWRCVYMSEEAVGERFGANVAKKIPYDATPEDLKRAGNYKSGEEGIKKQAKVIELWDKTRGKVCWFSKSMPEPLDERDDPLGLQEFFPCPRPLYATLTNESLVPVPDFSLYQDQAKELDVYADRIDGLTQMLQVKGVYDASADSSLARLFTEGENGTLLPVKNWAQFAEKGGLTGQVDIVDLEPIAKALQIAIEGMKLVKEEVYEITGISDIIRGQTQASETATAQQIKGQYASLRLRNMQDEVSQFATDLLRLKAQIICSKFAPQTIAAISAVEQLSPEDQKMIPQAMALLVGQERMVNPEAESPNPLRSFRIEVAADTLVQLDEQREKQDRMEFVAAVGQYLEKALPVVQASPGAGPLVLDLLKFGVRGFKVGKTIEGAFDAASEKLKQAAAQPRPTPPDPAIVKAQMDQQSEQARLAHEQQVAQEEAARERQKMQMEEARQQREMQANAQLEQWKAELESQNAAREAARAEGFERWKAELDADTKVIVAEIAAASKPEPGAGGGGEDGAPAAPVKPKRQSPLKAIAEAQADFMHKIGAQTEALIGMQGELAHGFKSYQEQQATEANTPVEFQRGADGRVASVKKGDRTMAVKRGPDGRAIGLG